MGIDLPNPPPPIFTAKKRKILSQLALPETEYHDASPKGSVDVGIRDLIDQINQQDGLVTTSSCAGRVSVYLEGKKTGDVPKFSESSGPVDDAGVTRASAGGKGGGEWLFVSHDPIVQVDGRTWGSLLGLGDGMVVESHNGLSEEPRLIHFKFEPMILHVLTASHTHAQLVVQAGLEAGFRESGAINITGPDATPMVAIRSMGLSFESLVGTEIDNTRKRIVSDWYLNTIVKLGNDRFAENEKRIARFQEVLAKVFSAQKAKGDWEDAETRRLRKREEGLRRKAELEKGRSGAGNPIESDTQETLIDQNLF